MTRHCLPFFISNFHCDTHFFVGKKKKEKKNGHKFKYCLKSAQILSLRKFVNNFNFDCSCFVLLFSEFQDPGVLLNQFSLLFFLVLYLLPKPLLSGLLFGAGREHFHLFSLFWSWLLLTGDGFYTSAQRNTKSSSKSSRSSHEGDLNTNCKTAEVWLVRQVSSSWQI